jgi:GNAT superfamily N-acetyltransferase
VKQQQETTICLELTSPGHLVPARAPSGIELRKVGADAADDVGHAYRRVFLPHGSAGRAEWTDDEWRTELASPSIHAWLAFADGGLTGLVELETEPDGSVGIVVFGVVPELIGHGYGGALLTLATRLAWELGCTRVRVQTSSRDHPHALLNYEARGFRIIPP